MIESPSPLPICYMIPNGLLQNQRLVAVHAAYPRPSKRLGAPARSALLTLLTGLTVMQVHCFIIGC